MVPRQTSNELACPCELSNSPCLYLTAESDSAVYFQPGRVECPYHPANTAGSNMEGYRYDVCRSGGFRLRSRGVWDDTGAENRWRARRVWLQRGALSGSPVALIPWEWQVDKVDQPPL